MMDNDTSCRPPMPLMYAAVVISVRVKCYRFTDGKCFGYRAKFPRTNYNGGSRMIAVDKFGFYDAV